MLSAFCGRTVSGPAQTAGRQAMNAGGFVARSHSRICADPIVVGILVFFIGHTIIRLFGTSNFSVDETMTAIHSQRFKINSE
jgi:hypothetical protein